VFDVFKRLQKKDIPGTGVGLALCKRIIERYGGAIWIRSDGKKGTAFFFTVPAARNENNVTPGDVS
jgi:signal transduction histidine kinase